MHIEKRKSTEDKKCSGGCGGCGGNYHSKEPSKESDENDYDKPWMHVNRLGLFEDSMSPELEQMEDDEDELELELPEVVV